MREIQFKEKDRQLWWFLRNLVVIYGYINDNGTSICKKWIIIIILRIWTTATEKLMKDEYWIWIFIFEMNRFFFQVSRKMQWLTDNIFSLNTKLGQNESFAIRSSPQTSISTSDDASVDKSWRNFWIWIKWIISCACFAAS